LSGFSDFHSTVICGRAASNRYAFSRLARWRQLLWAFDEVGLMGRVMFGSDEDSYGPASEAYRTAEFLSEQQIGGIFCRNVPRFLRRQEICDR
jgi:hypothetical protein